MIELLINDDHLKLQDVKRFVFDPEPCPVKVAPETFQKVAKANERFNRLLNRGVPIYGVTTGFGDSCSRYISKEKSQELQKNLINYLSCGRGALLPKAAAKAAMLFRLKSLSRGYSGVTTELLERIQLFLDNDWIPAIPRQGSLGASGDLIPLAYIARVLQGEGYIYRHDETVSIQDVLIEHEVPPYVLKPKEGIALVNGTSAMAGLALVTLKESEFLLTLSAVSSAWLCLTLNGRTEAFDTLINEKAKQHSGQTKAAAYIRRILAQENYTVKPVDQIGNSEGRTVELVQDRYSLRCSPQILGPVHETIDLAQKWLETEFNGVSDNPLIGEDDSLSLGGNFYGGYLSQGMDYLKISLAQIADMIDRQLMLLIDEKTNRGLTSNLVSDRLSDPSLHHGLKGLHQAVGAITSEIMPQATPNSIFSRSSESHNQDKVSLGMSAANQCYDMIQNLYSIQAMYLICLAQAIDLRKIQLQGETSKYLYKLVRSVVPFVDKDRPLDDQVDALCEELKELAPLFERKIPSL